MIGTERGQEDHVQIPGCDPGIGQCLDGSGQCQIGCGRPGVNPAPLFDTGALGDPLVGGVEHARQVVVGDHPWGQVAPDADDAGSPR